DSADFNTEVTVEKGEGVINVEALDEQGNYRNFLNLQTAVVSPKGERQNVRLEQTGPGHYEAHFPTKDVGVYLLHLMDIKDGQLRGSQVVGASFNYSPEFTAPEPNLNLMRRLAESGGGKLLDPMALTLNPFSHERVKTFQPRDLWEWLLRAAIILFTLDVGVRRIQIDRDEWLKATQNLRRWVFFWRGKPRPVEADESLAALLARRGQVRARQTAPAESSPDLLRPQRPVTTPSEAPAVTAARPVEDQRQEEAAEKTDAPPTTASRLLEAKRRARKKL